MKLIHALVKPRLRGDLPRATEWKKRAVMVPRRSGGGTVVETEVASLAPEVVVDRAA